MLCDLRDSWCLLESGSLNNTKNHPSDFTRIGWATQQPMSVRSAAASSLNENCECSCLMRSKPPLLPTALPFSATDANRAALQNWILYRYLSSTFNTCECQTHTLMEGPSWNFMSTPRSKPIAVLKPIPVPLHWQQEVKAFIDRVVKLGVLEALRVGESVTDAIGRSWLGRIMANHCAQWTCRCSTNMLSVKHTTPNSRFTSQRWYLQGPRM